MYGLMEVVGVLMESVLCLCIGVLLDDLLVVEDLVVVEMILVVLY